MDFINFCCDLLAKSLLFLRFKFSFIVDYNFLAAIPLFCAIPLFYNIAKFFVPILKQFTINEYTVKDSFSFCKEIIDQNPNLYMASFDVQSLFTNIPLDETINICVDMVYNKRKKVKGMLKRHFRQLLTISVKSSCFLFNDVYYKQIDGLLWDQH